MIATKFCKAYDSYVVIDHGYFTMTEVSIWPLNTYEFEFLNCVCHIYVDCKIIFVIFYESCLTRMLIYYPVLIQTGNNALRINITNADVKRPV